MEKLRQSSILKVLCYILIPILAAILFLSIVHITYLNEFEMNDNIATEYKQSQWFADKYFYSVLDKVGKAERSEETGQYIQLEDSKGQQYYYSEDYNHDSEICINYIIIDKETGKMYTNIKSNDYQQTMNENSSNPYYWNIVNGQIQTDINYMNQDNMKYDYTYYHEMIDTQPVLIDETAKTLRDYDIYTSYNQTRTEQSFDFVTTQDIYQFVTSNQKLPVYALAISLILLTIIAIYLLWAIGHKKGKEGITLNFIDELPYELVFLLFCCIIPMFWAIAVNSITDSFNYIFVTILIISYIICYVMTAALTITTIKRIKAKQFWRSFLTYKILRWCKNKIKKYTDEFKNKTSNTKKVFWLYWGFVLITTILLSMFVTGIAILIVIAFWIWAYYRLRKYVRQEEMLKETLKKIYDGDTSVHINEQELEGTLKEMAVYINDIAGGFKNAIEENLKSERLKTELITNVSHDIKTPLTSIINYVDLLKKEDIKDEKIKEYIDILDVKSQRLKKLTEDLVEASKASSGNVKLNIESINIKELINQTIGEFKDRLESRNLQIETDMLHEDVRIDADNRYMFRIMENLFSNISKYAQENSRVYIDVKKTNRKVNISIKNISKDRLNISSDELMQRFVRGDKSRYTEGSGLGLSIAKSLTELQRGTFDIVIDGDLFKVVMEWSC